MSLSHAVDVNTSHNNTPFQQLSQQVKELRKRSRARDAFDSLERELHQVFAEAAKQAIHLVSLVTPAEAETVFKEFGHMRPSKSSLDRLPKQLSEHWEAQREALDGQLCEHLEVPEETTMLSVSLDGVLVPIRYTRVMPGDSRYAEASCGTLSFYDKEGGILGTRYFSRMPEHKKKTLKGQLTQALEQVLAKRPSLEVIKIADGAKDNWTYLEDTLPQGECVLDFYHASEHLFAAMEAIYGKGDSRTTTQHARYRTLLRDDEHGVDKVLRHLRYQLRITPNKKALKAEVTYFSRQRHRCRYAQLKAANKPLGSGVVEAACKSIVQLRIKRSGQRWDDQGGQAILTFRSGELMPAKKKTKKKSAPGQVPEGDVRLVANIRKDLHKRFKHAAVDQETTVGDILEELIDKYLQSGSATSV